jgi:hypothetical protein
LNFEQGKAAQKVGEDPDPLRQGAAVEIGGLDLGGGFGGDKGVSLLSVFILFGKFDSRL